MTSELKILSVAQAEPCGVYPYMPPEVNLPSAGDLTANFPDLGSREDRIPAGLKIVNFNPLQPRDEQGRFAAMPGGGGGGVYKVAVQPPDPEDFEQMGSAKPWEVQTMSSVQERYLDALETATGISVDRELNPYPVQGGNDESFAVPEALQAEVKQATVAALTERMKNSPGYEDYEFLKRTFTDDGDDSELIAGWAKTSADNDLLSIMLQEAAAREFGLSESTTEHLDMGLLDRYVEVGMASPSDMDRGISGARAYLREMYTHSQETLKAAGIKELPVVRGMSFSDEAFNNHPGMSEMRDEWNDMWDVGGEKPFSIEMDMRTQPMSSFSVSPAVAAGFAWGDDWSAVSVGIVPAARIIAMPGTGFGCLGEYEVVILGGNDSFKTGVSKGYHDEAEGVRIYNALASGEAL